MSRRRLLTTLQLMHGHVKQCTAVTGCNLRSSKLSAGMKAQQLVRPITCIELSSAGGRVSCVQGLGQTLCRVCW